MKRRLLVAVMGAFLVGVATNASAQTTAPIVIKFSHVVAPDTPKGMAAAKFKELAEQRTNGRVKIDVYPNSALYKDGEEMEALQLGAVQMLAPSNSKFGPIGVREFEVFDLPYILPDLATLRKVTDGPLGAKLLKKLDPKGMTGLAYWDNGFKEMTANKKLITPADYKGVKFRIQSSKVLEAQFRSLGAITCGIAPSARICASSTFDDWIRIFMPLKSAGFFIGRLPAIAWKPLSMKPRPLMPFGSSLAMSDLPIGPSATRWNAASSGNTYGRSKTSNSFTPNGPNFASDGASICTAPSCSASISSLSL